MKYKVVSISSKNQILLLVGKVNISQSELDFIEMLFLKVKSWDELVSDATNQGYGPLFYNKITQFRNDDLIPSRCVSVLQQVYYKTLTRSTLLYDYFKKFIGAFVDQDIPIIPLKGIYLSEWLYKDIGLRHFSDIDLLVKEDYGLKCIDILRNSGFKPVGTLESEFIRSQKEIVHYNPMVKEGVSVEIHIKLHSSTEKYHLDNESIWKNAVPATINGMPVFALGRYDLLIHICVHLDKHFKSGHVQFTGFMDIVNLLEKCAGDNEWKWSEFIESCEKYNCAEEVFKYIVLCNKYMNATVPEEIISQFGYTLQEEDEELFFKYLNGFGAEKVLHGDYISGHFRNVSRLKTFSDKVHYIRDVMFPSKAFMINKYDPQPLKGSRPLTPKGELKRIPDLLRGKFWWLWYPYRWWVGVKGVILHYMRY